MADFTTHFLLGERMISKIDTDKASIIEANISAFNWGLQGPDLLFFRKAITGNSPLPKLGNIMHSKKTPELFKAFVEILQEMENNKQNEQRAALKAYFYGFICHYCLDKSIHPYVYFHQENNKKKQPSIPDSVIHAKIESCIDTQLYRLFLKQTITHFNLKEHYKIAKNTKETIATAYKKILKAVYNTEICEKEILACFNDTMLINKILYSRNKLITDFIIRAVEFLLKKPEAFSSHIKRRSCSEDYLNLEGHTWNNLWYPERKYKLTVPELFEQALSEAIQIINKVSLPDSSIPYSDLFSVSFDNGSPRS